MLIKVTARFLNGSITELETIFKKQIQSILQPLFVKLKPGSIEEVEEVLGKLLSEESPAEISHEMSWGWRLFEESHGVSGELSFYMKGVDVKPETVVFEMLHGDQKIQMEVKVIS